MSPFKTLSAKTLSATALSVIMLAACASEPSTPDMGDTSISMADLSRRIEKLASDEFEGRAPGTRGGQAASQYIADEMKLAGLEPAGTDGSYFQNVELTAATVINDQSSMVINSDNSDLPILNADQKTNGVYWTKRLDKNVEVKDADLVFVGYGITAPEYGWNDYADLDVKGKTVIILVNDPGFATKDDSLFKGNSMTYYGRWTYKYEEGGASRAALEGWVHIDVAEEIFAAAGLNYTTLKNQAAVKGFKPVPMSGLSLDATINQTVQTTTSRNVAGEIKGTTRADEYILYMAHWDHLGKKDDLEGDDKIYNGAVDNATGTASIIEIAESMAQGKQPERSVIFVAVTAEESGLLGSAYYAEAPLVPLNQTVAGINIDAMLPVGETKDFKVIGFGASELEDRLKSVLDKRNMYIVPDDKPEAGYYYRSDHISLAKKGVPMLYADPGNDHITKGLTYGEDFANDYTKERYHKPGDEYDNSWDLSGIKQSTEILYELGLNMANSEDWPNWYAGTEFRSLRDEMLKD